MILRVIDPSEAELCARLGQLVLAAYVALPGHPADPDYDRELVDVAGRARVAVVVAAFAGADHLGGAGAPIGCVTYVPDHANPLAERVEADGASFRMLGIDPSAQRTGAGRALTTWCIDRATADGKRTLAIHSGAWMTNAHRLYAELGFVRERVNDWVFVDEPTGLRVELWGFIRLL